MRLLSSSSPPLASSTRDDILMNLLATEYFPQSQRDEFQKQAYDALGPLKALTPNGGCYYSEASILEENWQQTFFGSNYPELLKIKQKYDPANVFNVFKGVGWTGPTDPTYSCYRQA